MPKLLKEAKINYMPSFLPAAWQTVILRNYGMVKTEKLAQALATDAETVHVEAERLGLKRTEADPIWLSRGYITIIRQNWHLLSYRQLLTVLEMTEAELAFILKEDDFLDVKLGNFKPLVKEPLYFPLTAEQSAATEKAAELIRKYDSPYLFLPFDFAADYFSPPQESGAADMQIIGRRFLYNYCAVYGDPFLDGAPDVYDDKTLRALADLGVNGLWVQGLLYKLCKFPFDTSLSERYEERIKNLNRLTKRLEKYGIKLYLYLNEPRSMPAAFFEKYPKLKGSEENGCFALCTSVQAVKDYLYNAMKYVAESVPALGGVFTITMSENLTHCYSRSLGSPLETACLRCAARKPWELAAEVNNILQKALTDAKTGAVLLANIWQWNLWPTNGANAAISLLDKKITVLSVSEDRMPIDICGVKSEVIDYSISHHGPSPLTVSRLKAAAGEGCQTAAKVQINNSWECSAAPFLPVFPLIHKHLSDLAKLDISALMLGWTLGGFPSPNLALAREFYNSKTVDLKAWYNKIFGKDAQNVENACQKLSDAFSLFPFSLPFLYTGPQNYGPSVFLSLEKIDLDATMIGFPYDDVKQWRDKLTEEQLIGRLKAMSVLWSEGTDELIRISNPSPAAASVIFAARAAQIHFSSSYIQTEFAVLKCGARKNKNALLELVFNERRNTEKMLDLIVSHPSVGYEASNHYYYIKNTMLEKLLNLEQIEEQLKAL